jgi:hypothetical protein
MPAGNNPADRSDVAPSGLEAIQRQEPNAAAPDTWGLPPPGYDLPPHSRLERFGRPIKVCSRKPHNKLTSVHRPDWRNQGRLLIAPGRGSA